MNESQDPEETAQDASSPDATGKETPEGTDMVAANDDAVIAEFEGDAEERVSQAPAIAAALIVDVDGYEGPIDVLLMLARSQKVDLKTISILQLVDQYLAFVTAAKEMNLELAADYLVMAAWLTYLKSRLIIPQQEVESDEPSGEEMAARLAFQLQRLQAMRDVGARLMARDRLGRDVFTRGMPEGIRLVRKPKYEATMFELLKGYSDGRTRGVSHEEYHLRRAPVFTIEDARNRIEKMFGKLKDWSSLDSLLPQGWVTTKEEGISEEAKARTAKASTFTASLELAKDGHVELKQLANFGPIYVRWRDGETSGSKVG